VRGKHTVAEAVVTGVMKNGRPLAEELVVLDGGAGRLPLADCLVLVSGKGHREALQRVISQDVLALRPGEGKLALLLAPKGQFRAIMAVFVGAEKSYLVTPPGRGKELAARLTKYLALSRCTAKPVEGVNAVAVLGGGFRDVLAAVGLDAALLAEGGWHGSKGALWFGRTLLGVPGAVAVVQEPAASVTLEERLAAAGATQISVQGVELARIRVGWPAWGAELTETVLPLEVGIEDETVSFAKGCYVGQETIARMRTYGHPNRGLVGLRQLSGSVDRPALPLALVGVGEAKVRGSLTSWAWHPDHGGIGLALVRRELTNPGAHLAGDDREFEVTRFPLW
jgi:folate-binding protein YgfZ